MIRAGRHKNHACLFTARKGEAKGGKVFVAIRSPTLYVGKLGMLVRPPNRVIKIKVSYSVGYLLEKACWRHSFEDTGINDKQAKYLLRLDETTRAKN